jgi:hypothetical protein
MRPEATAIGSTPPTTAPSDAVTSSGLASPIPVESGLLDRLPQTIDGLERQTDPSVDASIASDPNLARLARSFATALYIDATTGQFAYVSLVRLNERLAAASAASYRESFDEAACSQAGGLARTAEATIGEHRTFIGTCGGGVRTYHVELADGGIILSVSETGERRLAEKLIRGLGE